MPGRKEWVIDEKGLHAKTTWQKGQADQEAVTPDDHASDSVSNTEESSPYAKIVINSAEMVPGPDGLAFNKKFTAKAGVDVKDEKASKKVTFRLYCRYKGEEFEIVPEEYGYIRGDTAEKEMTLFYAEKADGCTYYDDSFKDPSLTCEYFLRVSHPDIESIKESDPITIPQKETKENGLKVPPGSVKLDEKEKLKLVQTIGVLESGKDGYSAVNKDYEFEGKITVSYSKDSDKPRHVGLSFGIIQFTQESSLGSVVNKMHKKNPKRFEEVFGKDSDKLLAVLSKKGAVEYKEETFIDTKGKTVTKKVGRAPSVCPVGGIDLWKSPWVERFVASGEEPDFQKCQDEVAIENYLEPILTFCKTNAIKSQKALALVYDRHVNSGPGGLRGIKNYSEENKKQNVNSKEFWIDYAKTFTGTYSWINTRMQKIINSTELSWEVNYEF